MKGGERQTDERARDKERQEKEKGVREGAGDLWTVARVWTQRRERARLVSRREAVWQEADCGSKYISSSRLPEGLTYM